MGNAVARQRVHVCVTSGVVTLGRSTHGTRDGAGHEEIQRLVGESLIGVHGINRLGLGGGRLVLIGHIVKEAILRGQILCSVYEPLTRSFENLRGCYLVQQLPIIGPISLAVWVLKFD